MQLESLFSFKELLSTDIICFRVKTGYLAICSGHLVTSDVMVAIPPIDALSPSSNPGTGGKDFSLSPWFRSHIKPLVLPV